MMNVRRQVWLLVWLLALLAWVPVRTGAQVAITATVTGFVTDPSAAFVPGAAVTIVNTATGATRTTETSAEGAYTFPGLPIGTYDLTVTKAGFQSYKRSGITLHVNQTARVDITLQLGEVSQAIEVVGQATLVQTETSSQGQVVEERRLSDLPLNGRNPIQLVSLVAGATVVNAPTILSGFRGGSTASVNGSRMNENNFLFDSNNYSSVYFNTGLNYPNPDALQEFKLITHNYSAELGRNAGSVFNAVSKSGSNEFHGSVWEFLRNDALNARNFFSKSVPMLRQNQFGFVAGGPVIKNKLFWFGSYQGFRIRQQSLLANQRVATANERAGIFSTPITDPQTGEPFPDNTIPPERLSPIATNWYNTYVPLPDNPDGTTITRVGGSPRTVDQYLAKADWNITSKQVLTGRWFYDKSQVTNAFSYAVPDYANALLTTTQQDGSITHTYMISPTLLNQAHFGLNHIPFDNNMTPDSLAFKVSTTSLGINMPAMRPYAPVFTIAGNVGGWINAERESGLSHQYGDTLTWVRGKHTFKFGMEVLVDDYHNRSYAFTQGAYTFDGTFTGNGLADFLVGLPASVQYNSAYIVDSQSKKYYTFFQDDWKVSPRLTLNLGFRYELNNPYIDNSPSPIPNQQATFHEGQQSTVFPNAPTGLVYPGDAGIPPGLYPLPKWNLEPRLGFAWDPRGDGKWVIRGAVGLFADVPIPDLIGQTHANQPFTLSTRLFAPAGGLADPFLGFPGGNPWPFTFDPDNVSFVTPAVIESNALDYRDPRITQWNLSVQRSFGANWLFDIAYVGSTARHLNRTIQGNPARYIPGVDEGGNPLSTPANVDSRRVILPGTIGSIQFAGIGGVSNFNSLQFTVQKRMSQGLMLLSSYTYSHSIDNRSAFGIGGVSCQDPFDCRAERASSDYDRRHVYALSVIYDLPKPRSDNWAMRNILGGWGLASIFNAGTGTPFTVSTGKNNMLSGDGNDRPMLVGDPLAGVDRSSRASAINKWFNTAAFVQNPIGTPGSSGRNILYNPGNWNLDVSVLRDFVVSEKYGRLQFRSEFFNIFNNVNLGGVVANLQSSQFGRLTSAGAPRLIQFGLKYIW